MNPESLMSAIQEAEHFIQKARDLKDAIILKDRWHPAKESGACRRASLDLARALAEMRKPG